MNLKCRSSLNASEKSVAQCPLGLASRLSRPPPRYPSREDGSPGRLGAKTLLSLPSPSPSLPGGGATGEAQRRAPGDCGDGAAWPGLDPETRRLPFRPHTGERYRESVHDAATDATRVRSEVEG